MLTSDDKVGGWVKKGQNHDDVILEWSLSKLTPPHCGRKYSFNTYANMQLLCLWHFYLKVIVLKINENDLFDFCAPYTLCPKRPLQSTIGWIKFRRSILIHEIFLKDKYNQCDGIKIKRMWNKIIFIF